MTASNNKQLTQTSGDSCEDNDIFKKCCCQLILLTSPDAIIRSKRSLKQPTFNYFDVYFNKQKHHSLIEFVRNQLELADPSEQSVALQVSKTV